MTDSSPLTALDEAVTAQRPEPKRDRWERYLLPHPETGKEQAWTRATTWAKSCSDTFGITKWELRMCAVGLARRPDLLAQAATVADPDDPDAKKMLGQVCDQAKEFAGTTVRRNLGTALHSFTEALDRGQTPTVPQALQPDLDAYLDAMKRAGITMDVEHIERIVVVPELEVAGTFDRLVTYDGRLLVADLKTGRDVSYGMGEIAIQLALYAHGTNLWDHATGSHEPMPTVDQDRALVLHLPVGEARCTIYEVDIAAGWEMAHICGVVRTWRKRRDLARTVTAVTDETHPGHVEAPKITPPQTRDEWLSGRIKVLVASKAAKAMLAQRWPINVAKRAPWTDEQIDTVTAIVAAIENEVEAPFAYPDPAAAKVDNWLTTAPPAGLEQTHPDEGPLVDPAVMADLKARAVSLDRRQAAQCRSWRGEGKRDGHPWGGAVDGVWTERCAADNAAALACATHLYDSDEPDALTRAALGEVISDNLQPSWATGAVIGSLTIDAARYLADVAEAFGANDPDICAALGRRITAA